jgi:germination protein M
MMKKRVACLLALLMVVNIALTGCSGDGSNITASVIYDINENNNGVVREEVEIKSKSVEGQIKEYLDLMKKPAASGDMIRPLNTKINFQDYKYSSSTGSLTLSFDRTYENMQGVEELLRRACIVLTLLQVEGVSDVTFEVEHEPLRLENEMNPVGAMNEDSFVLSLTGNDSMSQKASLNLFYPSTKGDGLFYEKRNVSYASNMSLERVVMRYLSEIPSTKEAMPALSANTSILNIYVADGVCYLNLASSFTDGISDEMLKLKVYAIVDSLCQLTRVKRVQISVEGKNLNLEKDTASSEDALYLPDESLILNKVDMNK